MVLCIGRRVAKKAMAVADVPGRLVVLNEVGDLRRLVTRPCQPVL